MRGVAAAPSTPALAARLTRHPLPRSPAATAASPSCSYTAGFKAASKVTDAGKAALRAALPPSATAAFDHRLSRYLKRP